VARPPPLAPWGWPGHCTTTLPLQLFFFSFLLPFSSLLSSPLSLRITLSSSPATPPPPITPSSPFTLSLSLSLSSKSGDRSDLRHGLRRRASQLLPTRYAQSRQPDLAAKLHARRRRDLLCHRDLSPVAGPSFPLPSLPRTQIHRRDLPLPLSFYFIFFIFFF
jgi:hypothetical protein